jgi:hypothetical protein
VRPYDDFLISKEGCLWVQKTRGSHRDGRSYWIFDSTGRLSAQARLPTGTVPIQVWADTMLARRIDQDDVVRIELYPIEW